MREKGVVRSAPVTQPEMRPGAGPRAPMPPPPPPTPPQGGDAGSRNASGGVGSGGVGSWDRRPPPPPPPPPPPSGSRPGPVTMPVQGISVQLPPSPPPGPDELWKQRELLALYQAFQRHQVEVASGVMTSPPFGTLRGSGGSGVASREEELSGMAAQGGSGSLQTIVPSAHLTSFPAGTAGRPQNMANSHAPVSSSRAAAAAATAEDEESKLELLYNSPSVAAARKEAGLPDYQPADYGLSDLPKAPSHAVPAVRRGDQQR